MKRWRRQGWLLVMLVVQFGLLVWPRGALVDAGPAVAVAVGPGSGHKFSPSQGVGPTKPGGLW
ncbi:hypothetical protein [Lacticaseibacillus daqingensis]|uniref:hypothetical protein n=1 Tax=Lacticaseibacillus daqingensis TaxID=2486014 RepID=UPI000F78F5D3|nr:hypothetical protein [Lacticaseibacillus daqingensis]